jgi:hypothetical protein
VPRSEYRSEMAYKSGPSSSQENVTSCDEEKWGDN